MHSPLTTAENPNKHKTSNATRKSWGSSALTFYNQPLVLDYSGLDKNAAYVAEFVFITKKPEKANLGSTKASFQVPVRLMANDEVIHDYFLPPWPVEKFIVPVPRTATAGGSLSLSCRQHVGVGGTGRNCELAEVWLRKSP